MHLCPVDPLLYHQAHEHVFCCFPSSSAAGKTTVRWMTPLALMAKHTCNIHHMSHSTVAAAAMTYDRKTCMLSELQAVPRPKTTNCTTRSWATTPQPAQDRRQPPDQQNPTQSAAPQPQQQTTATAALLTLGQLFSAFNFSTSGSLAWAQPTSATVRSRHQQA